MREKPLVSIIVNNYNYERYLGQALDSALSQNYPEVEIVVVDDGSTDGSREVISGYGKRVVPVLKANGGQGSAINAGFAASTGQIAIFLDADDELLPDAVQRVVDRFRVSPEIAKVQWRLTVTDAGGEPSGETVPPLRIRLPEGDLRPRILKFHSYARSPMSGNAFAARVLERILPMPEELYRIDADLYLSDLSVMYGEVAALEEPAALYRVHGTNNYSSIKSIDLPRLRQSVLRTSYNLEEQRRIFASLYGGERLSSGKWDPLFLRRCVSCLKLDSANYPLDDRLFELCVRGFWASLISPATRAPSYKGFANALWFLGMLLAPRAVAKSLAEEMLYRSTPDHRPSRLYSALWGARRRDSVSGSCGG